MAATDNPHGEANLNPDHYTVVDYVDWCPWDGLTVINERTQVWIAQVMAELEAMRERLRAGTSVYGTGQCAHCGNALRYGVILQDARDGAHLQVGRDCASARFALTESAWATRKAALDAMRAQAAAGEKRVRVRRDYPEAVAILERCLDDRTVAEAAYSDHAALPAEWQAWTGRWSHFLRDVAQRMERTADLSAAQAAAVVKSFDEDRARAEEWAYRDAERRQADPVPTGKGLTVEGEIVSCKVHETQWGSREVMTVKSDAGWLVWGTLPTALYDAGEGYRVRFVANVEPSDDPTFGFFKRPRQAVVLD